MKHIVFNKKDNRVVNILDKKPLSVTDNLDIAQCENIPEKPQFGFLTVKNLETKTEEYTDFEKKEVEKINEETKAVEIVEEEVEVVKTREYQTCELEAVENPNKDKILQIQNTKKLIKEKKELLEKYKYDIQQVDLFGMQRDDYEEKKKLCSQLVLELRELEKLV